MNNEENNVDLPKRVDEVKPLPVNENNQNVFGTPSVNQNSNEFNVENLSQREPEEPALGNMPPAGTSPEVFPNIEQAQVNPQTVQPQNNPAVNPNLAGNVNQAPVFPAETVVQQPVQPQPVPVIEPTAHPQPMQQPVIEPQPMQQPVVEPQPAITPQPVQQPVVEPQQVAPAPQVSPSVGQAPNQEVQLEKKLVVEKPTKKKKEKKQGNAFVGFLAVLIIILIIGAAFYYFISQGIIKVPGNLNLPFLPTQIKETTTQPIVNENDNEEEEQVQEGARHQNVVLYGTYTEQSFNVCPDTPVTLILNEDKSYILNSLNHNQATGECAKTEITGSFIEEKNRITLEREGEESIIARLTKEENSNIITIQINNTLTNLYKNTANEEQ